ncbi:hypothetical protein EDE12_11238 [Methylosinus sp. sav-2]|uniref:hypothetical protein n=1 Tax=Methylosinus sp. sav-2 TaxID=2485168 RepID=UPI0010E8E63F|nr:hypothetical protein [Methylosinus sp. sav-2]TDX61937.1 hypothetical protein EDE12_11238 [Methylosinus sp. sav-2]
MTTEVKLICEVSAWVRPAVLALAFMARIGIHLDYGAIVERIVSRGVKVIVERKA